MDEKTKAKIRKHMGSHIVWMCPEMETCPDCGPSGEAWELLKEALRPRPKKKRKA